MRVTGKLLFSLLFLVVVTVTHYCYAEEITLTEEQERELLNTLEPKLQKMKSDLEKINQMQQMQNNQDQSTGQRDRSTNISESGNSVKEPSSEPEWDGVYVKTMQNSYVELKPATRGSAQRGKNLFSSGIHYSIVLLKSEINYISAEEIKGFYFKGKGASGKIKVNRIEKIFNPLTELLSGKSQDFRMEEYDKDNNLFVQMRVRSSQDSLYAEPRNHDLIRQYLRGDNCLAIYVEKGLGNLYAICPN